MATKKPYSYHAQLSLLSKAIDAMKVVCARLEDAFDNEVVQLGPEDATAGDYHALSNGADDFQVQLEDHAAAVRALAEMTPPDKVEPGFDPTDFTRDERWEQALGGIHDLAKAYGVDPTVVARSLQAAACEGDQR